MDGVTFLEALTFISTGGYLELFARADDSSARLFPRCFSRYATCPLDGEARLAGIRKAIHGWNTEGYGIHFAPATRAKTFPSNQRGKKDDTHELLALWGDIDWKETPQDEAKARIDALPVKPTFVVCSGGGYHVYYFLKDAVGLYAGNRPMVERTLRGLAQAMGSDPQVAKINATMRLPGTRNRKPKYGANGAACHIVSMTQERHHYAELEVLYAPLVAAPTIAVQSDYVAPSTDDYRPRWLQDYLQYGEKEGNRNSALFGAACWYHNNDKPLALAERELTARGEADGLEAHEIRATIRSAFRQPRKAQPTRSVASRYAGHERRIGEVRKRRGK